MITRGEKRTESIQAKELSKRFGAILSEALNPRNRRQGELLTVMHTLKGILKKENIGFEERRALGEGANIIGALCDLLSRFEKPIEVLSPEFKNSPHELGRVVVDHHGFSIFLARCGIAFPNSQLRLTGALLDRISGKKETLLEVVTAANPTGARYLKSQDAVRLGIAFHLISLLIRSGERKYHACKYVANFIQDIGWPMPEKRNIKNKIEDRSDGFTENGRALMRAREKFLNSKLQREIEIHFQFFHDEAKRRYPQDEVKAALHELRRIFKEISGMYLPGRVR